MRVTLYDNDKVITELELKARTVLECLPLFTIPDGVTHWQFTQIDHHRKKCYGPPKR